jgi:hypothetical protein
MADINETLRAYLDTGIDPTLADTNAQYARDYTASSRMNALPEQMNRMYASSGAGYDPSMVINSMKMDSLMRSVDQTNQIMRQMMMTIEQSGRQNESTINSLSRMQMLTQQQITQQQISMQQAQWKQASMFQSAPSLAYQVSPEMAIFRNQLQSANMVAARGQQSSFMHDLMLSLPATRPYAETAFFEDPFMSSLGASRRMAQRWETIGRTAGEVGSSLAGSAAGYGLTKAGTAMAMRMAIGTAIPGVGTAAAMVDQALDMAGLPSVSGAVADTASKAWNVTGGRPYVTLDMARDIQRATPYVTGRMANISGQGLNLTSSTKIVNSMRQMSAKDTYLGTEDYMGIFMEASKAGMFNMAGNDEQFIRGMRDVSKNLRMFMRISGDPDYKNAIKAMGDMFRMGVPLEKLGNAALNTFNFARMAGLSGDTAAVFGKQGALMYQQAGADMATGYQAGIMNRALTRMSMQNQSMSPAYAAAYGGEEGVAQMMTEMSAGFVGGPFSQVMVAGLMKKGADGKLVVDQKAIRKMASMQMGMNELMDRSNLLMQDKEAKTDYILNAKEYALQATAAGGPALGLTGSVMILKDIMQRSNVSYAEAAAMYFGRDRGALFVKNVNAGNMKNMVEAENRNMGQEQFRDLKILEEEMSLINRVGRFGKQAWQGSVGAWADERAAREAQRLENRERLNMGMLPINLGDRTAKQQAQLDRFAGITGPNADTEMLRRTQKVYETVNAGVLVPTVRNDIARNNELAEKFDVTNLIDDSLLYSNITSQMNDPQADYSRAVSTVKAKLESQPGYNRLSQEDRNRLLNMAMSEFGQKVKDSGDVNYIRNFDAGKVENLKVRRANLERYTKEAGDQILTGDDKFSRPRERMARRAFYEMTMGGKAQLTTAVGNVADIAKRVTGKDISQQDAVSLLEISAALKNPDLPEDRRKELEFEQTRLRNKLTGASMSLEGILSGGPQDAMTRQQIVKSEEQWGSLMMEISRGTPEELKKGIVNLYQAQGRSRPGDTKTTTLSELFSKNKDVLYNVESTQRYLEQQGFQKAGGTDFTTLESTLRSLGAVGREVGEAPGATSVAEAQLITLTAEQNEILKAIKGNTEGGGISLRWGGKTTTTTTQETPTTTGSNSALDYVAQGNATNNGRWLPGRVSGASS